ncbi:hypothetical protein M885DRAFT_590908 [Pelagophyceae sp. CCMP2097]|nr:hypothetical protein M885DRAFT_590908 [Pelagophyceae sp. CCMP2097]
MQHYDGAGGSGKPEVSFRVCTMNVGGRNTNSFEFEMRGDTTPAAVKWLELYATAKNVLNEKGPAGLPGLADAVDDVVRLLEGSRVAGDILSRVLLAQNWTNAMEVIGDESNMLINACNLASLRDGRPAPLEMPENVVKLATVVKLPPLDPRASPVPTDAFGEFARVWLRWLATVTPQQRGKWGKRASKYKVALSDAVAAMFLFDAMCFEALIYMYAGDEAQPAQATVAKVMREHLKFHNWLPFTTEAGKYMKLIEVLAELQFPEVVCLQEAYDLVVMATDEREKSQLGDRLFSTFEDKYAIHCAGETALLLRNDRFAAGDYKLDEKLDAAQGGWRSVLEARGLALHGGTKIVDDWNTTLSRTVVVKARLHKLLYRDATAPTSARKLMPARWTSQMMLSPSDRAASQVGAQTVPLVLCALHGKGGSEVMDTFVTELADVLSDVPHVDAFVIGMDSNTSNADALQATLTRRGIMSSEAVSSSQKTVSKSRTLFQTQVRKTGVLDISLKDFVVAWKVDSASAPAPAPDLSNLLEEAAAPSTSELRPATPASIADDAAEAEAAVAGPRDLLPLVQHTEHFPEIQDANSNVAMLMPTAQWPFDHSMVIVAISV